MTKIYEAGHVVWIRTGYGDPEEHRHMAAHIIISLGDGIGVYSGANYIACPGVMIPTGVYHRIDTRGNPALVFLFDCTSNAAEQIREMESLPENICQRIVQWYGQLEALKMNTDPVEQLLNILDLPDCYSTVTDDRILRAMEYIRENCGEKITCRHVADAVYLSPDRFSHLFKHEVGMTFAAYLICQRLMRVYSNVFRGKSVTEAALEAGFSGSSHFADVNRRVFGIPISRIMENAVFTKVS